MIQQTDAVLEAIINALIDTGGPYDPATLFLGLFSAVTDNGPQTVLADVTQATGAVATRVALTPWGAPYKLNDGRWVVDAPPAAFSPANAGEGQVVTGYFIASLAVAGVLKAWDLFDAPVNLVDEFSQVTVIFRLTVDPDGRWSESIVFNG